MIELLLFHLDDTAINAMCVHMCVNVMCVFEQAR